MIKSLHIKNFKCLFDVTVDLAPFTILIGPNDSGKSSFIDAIQLLGRTASGQIGAVFQAKNELTDLVSRKDATQNVSWITQGTADNHPFTYTLQLACNKLVAGESLRVNQTEGFDREGNPSQDQLRVLGDRRGVVPIGKTMTGLFLASHGGAASLPVGSAVLTRKGISSSAKYRLDPLLLRSDATAVRDAGLSPEGDNLTAVIDDILTSPDRTLER